VSTTALKKLDVLRGQIAALEAERLEPALVCVPRATVRAAISAQIDTWHAHAAERVAQDLQRMAAGNAVDLLGAADTFGYKVDPLTLIDAQAVDTRAWLTLAAGKGAMLERFEPLLAEMPDGLDSTERAKRLAEIDRQIVAAEVREEALIREAEGQGIVIDPRPGQRAEASILIGFGDE
jgi:hypothetical protein